MNKHVSFSFSQYLILCIVFFFIIIQDSFAAETLELPVPAKTITIDSSQLAQFDDNKPEVKQLIQNALELASMRIGYKYGSANPDNGGMDCSGTANYLLSKFLKKVPRQSDEFYNWAQQDGHLIRVKSHDLDSKEFDKLKPGDILFWTGTYSIRRKTPITHVMIYLGKNHQQQPLMFGSSDGRSYGDTRLSGVSVYTFKLPSRFSRSKFVGYSCIPGLTCD